MLPRPNVAECDREDDHANGKQDQQARADAKDDEGDRERGRSVELV